MKQYSYELTENGYYIYIDGKKVIHQYEPYIPNPLLNYEENAKTQIEELKEQDIKIEEEKSNQQSLAEQITDIQLALAEIYESEV